LAAHSVASFAAVIVLPVTPRSPLVPFWTAAATAIQRMPKSGSIR
jgi:hypothetical protein